MIPPAKNAREYGIAQEFRIIDALRRSSMTEFQIAELLGVTRKAAHIYTSRMRNEKRIRICDHLRNVSGRPLPLFGLGSEPDVVYIPVKPRKERQGDRAENTKRAVLALLEKPHTISEMMGKLHKTSSILRFYVRELRDERLVRIADWKHVGKRNGLAPVYKAGKNKDKPMPPAMTTAECNARRRCTPEKREQEQSKRRIREHIRSVRTKPQGIFAALGI